MVFCQTKSQDDKIFAIATRQTCKIVVKVIDSNQNTATLFGCGIVLRGQYVATCYHVLEVLPNEKIVRIYALCMRSQAEHGPSNIIYDTIDVTRDFKLKPGQYDFSKHLYDPHDLTSDFMVFKLKKKIKPVEYQLAKEIPTYLSDTYALGNVLAGKFDTKLAPTKLLYLYHSPINEYQTADYLTFGGSADMGFSGAPLYNSAGKLLGIIQGGNDDFPGDVVSELRSGDLAAHTTADKIVQLYSQHLRIGIAIDIHYVVDRYLKGYMK